LVFLTCQDTAFETRNWPKTIEISHGETRITEVVAEDTAAKLGLLEEYQKAVREDAGIIAEAARRLNKLTGRLRNARARCLCGYTNKRGQLKLHVNVGLTEMRAFQSLKPTIAHCVNSLSNAVPV
jgi:hypothetical protein